MLYQRISLLKFVAYEDEATQPLNHILFAPAKDIPELEKLKDLPGPVTLKLVSHTRLGIFLNGVQLGEIRLGRSNVWVKKLITDLKELAKNPNEYIF